MAHAKMTPDNRIFFPGLYLHHEGENLFTEKQGARGLNISHVLHGSLFLRLLELILAASV